MAAVKIFRISQAKHGPDLFTGKGGLYAEGTWHTKGRAVVYGADSLSAGQLEILVNYGKEVFVGAWLKSMAEAPARLIQDCPALPAGWQNNRPLTRAIGDAWLASGDKPVMRVPSKITSGEFNFLINPEHKDFGKLKLGPAEPFHFDDRLEGRVARDSAIHKSGD